MQIDDLDVVAPLVVQYMRFLSDQGGLSRSQLLTEPLTASQRKMLTSRMDDLDFLYKAVGQHPKPATIRRVLIDISRN